MSKTQAIERGQTYTDGKELVYVDSVWENPFSKSSSEVAYLVIPGKWKMHAVKKHEFERNYPIHIEKIDVVIEK